MKIYRFGVLVILTLTLFGFLPSAPRERLWISFIEPFPRKDLMEIDAFGNIIRPPSKVAELFDTRHGGDTALSIASNDTLNLWFISAFDGKIFRFIIDKKTLKTLRIIKTRLKGRGGYLSLLSVTHRTKNNLISFDMPNNDGIQIVAFPIDENGQVAGRKLTLSPTFVPECRDQARCGGGMTANGRLAFWSTVNLHNLTGADLFIRPVGALGHPIGNAILIDHVVSRGGTQGFSVFWPADATDVLPGNKRYLAYVKSPGMEDPPSTLLLQSIDPTTGKKLNEKITLFRSNTAYPYGNVKIDPLGRFVIFTANSSFDSTQGLYYLALDATGHPKGRPKSLTTLAGGGIDLLREVLR